MEDIRLAPLLTYLTIFVFLATKSLITIGWNNYDSPSFWTNIKDLSYKVFTLLLIFFDMGHFDKRELIEIWHKK